MNLRKYLFTIVVLLLANFVIAMQNDSSKKELDMPYFLIKEILAYLPDNNLQKLALAGSNQYKKMY